MAPTRVTSYQFGVLTPRPHEEILNDIAARGFGGIEVSERGASYILLRPPTRYHYTPDVAIGLAVLIVLASLILTSVSPLFLLCAPLALVTAIPIYFDHQPSLVVGAVADEDGATRVTVHGQASPELSAALDAYFGALPPVAVPEPVDEREPEGAGQR